MASDAASLLSGSAEDEGGTTKQPDSSPVKEGWIRKEAPHFYTRSHRRWFVLDEAACMLRYFEDAARAAAWRADPARERGPLGEIDLAPGKVRHPRSRFFLSRGHGHSCSRKLVRGFGSLI